MRDSADRTIDTLIVAAKAVTIACGIDALLHGDSARLRGKAIRLRAVGRGLDRFMPGPLHGPGAAFRTAMDAVAPDAVILGLVPGGSTSIALSPT